MKVIILWVRTGNLWVRFGPIKCLKKTAHSDVAIFTQPFFHLAAIKLHLDALQWTSGEGRQDLLSPSFENSWGSQWYSTAQQVGNDCQEVSWQPFNRIPCINSKKEHYSLYRFRAVCRVMARSRFFNCFAVMSQRKKFLNKRMHPIWRDQTTLSIARVVPNGKTCSRKVLF